MAVLSTITGVSGAVNGSVSFNSQTNTVTFTPNTGYTGAASFSYAIADGQGGTATATVSLTVNTATNQQPVANNDSGYSTTRDTALTGCRVCPACERHRSEWRPADDHWRERRCQRHRQLQCPDQSRRLHADHRLHLGAASFSWRYHLGWSWRHRDGNDQLDSDHAGGEPVLKFRHAGHSFDPDAAQVNLGVRFTSSAAGTINGIKYYKGTGDTGTHTGSLWSSTGTLLATATSTNETQQWVADRHLQQSGCDHRRHEFMWQATTATALHVHGQLL